MNAKISMFVICVEAIMYLLLYNLDDCTFNSFQCHFISGFISFHFVSFNYKKLDV